MEFKKPEWRKLTVDEKTIIQEYKEKSVKKANAVSRLFEMIGVAIFVFTIINFFKGLTLLEIEETFDFIFIVVHFFSSIPLFIIALVFVLIPELCIRSNNKKIKSLEDDTVRICEVIVLEKRRIRLRHINNHKVRYEIMLDTDITENQYPIAHVERLVFDFLSENETALYVKYGKSSGGLCDKELECLKQGKYNAAVI